MEAHNNDSGSFERNAGTGRVRDSQLQSHKQKGYQKKFQSSMGGRTRVNDPVIFTPVTYNPEKKKKNMTGSSRTPCPPPSNWNRFIHLYAWRGQSLPLLLVSMSQTWWAPAKERKRRGQKGKCVLDTLSPRYAQTRVDGEPIAFLQ